MKEKHIILRSPRPNTSDPFLGPLATGMAEAAAAGPVIEIDEIERRDIPAMTNNADVLAIVRSFR